MTAKIAFVTKVAVLFVLVVALKAGFGFIGSALEIGTANPAHYGSALSWVACGFLALLVWSGLLISMNGARGREEV